MGGVIRLCPLLDMLKDTSRNLLFEKSVTLENQLCTTAWFPKIEVSGGALKRIRRVTGRHFRLPIFDIGIVGAQFRTELYCGQS